MTLLSMYVFLVTYFPLVVYCISLHMYNIIRFQFDIDHDGLHSQPPLVVKLSTAGPVLSKFLSGGHHLPRWPALLEAKNSLRTGAG